MESTTPANASRLRAPRWLSTGNADQDGGFESLRCELHRYSDEEIRLDRRARGGDRLCVEAVPIAKSRFCVAYTICPPDGERPRCRTPVTSGLTRWGDAVDRACDIVANFARRSKDDPTHAVLGCWNPWHVIAEESELRAWRWDGETVFDLSRQTMLLDRFPEYLRRYAAGVPARLRVEDALRVPDDAMRGHHLMNVVAADRRGYVLLRTTWFGHDDGQAPSSYTVLPAHIARKLVSYYRRTWRRAHARRPDAGYNPRQGVITP